ncbi:3'-phosphoadenosine 5'-phosphosulfate 3'-phosphatase [[Haemophilus] ducreyi]|nr:3'-phosphoadenosine 5'-phosphosulfate 3'-phosphatase [[Haemophilus] ducreyi]
MRTSGAFLQENGIIRPLTPHKIMANNERLRIAMGATNRTTVAQCLQQPLQADIFQYGSSSLKAGLVAEGKADCYIRLGDTGEWDTAAAEVLLNEIGGKIFDLNFQPLSYNQRQHFINLHFVMVADKQADWQKIFQFNE